MTQNMSAPNDRLSQSAKGVPTGNLALVEVIDSVLAHLSESIHNEHNIPRKEALLTVVDSLLEQRNREMQ